MNRCTLKSRHTIKACLFAAVGFTAGASVAHAEATWTGFGGGSGVQLWHTIGNWSPNAVPASGADVRFRTFNSGTVINLVGDRSVGKLTFDTAFNGVLQNFAGAGNTLTLNSGDVLRTAATSSTQTLSTNVALGAAGVWEIRGTGELVVEGALSSADGIAFDKFGPGALRFISSASTIGGQVIVSEGTMTLDQGANFSINGTGTTSTLTVASPGSSLVVKGGAVLNTRFAPQVGQGASAVVSGANSRWINTFATGQTSSNFFVGQIGTGVLAVQNGGSFSTVGNLQIGFSTGSAGTLTIDSGGVVSSTYGAIGSSQPNMSAVVTVSGVGSAWNSTQGIDVGGTTATSAGSLTVSSGGAVTTAGQLRLLGAASNVTVNAGRLTVGGLFSAGAGSINLAADAGDDAALTINSTIPSFFSGTLTGPGSIVKNGDSSQVLLGSGINHSGNTTINAGTLLLPNGLPAQSSTVFLRGGSVETGGNINRALANGTGTMTSALIANNIISIGDATRTDGFDYRGAITVNNKLTLNDADLATTDGTITLNVNTSLASANGIKSNGQLRATSGSTTVSGTFVNNGGVYGPALTAGTLLTFSNEVSGTGGLNGKIAFNGKYAPGNSGASAIAADGRITFGPNATFGVDLGGTVSGTQHDALAITGSATLDGTLAVSTINNFSPQQGQVFKVLTATDGFDDTKFDQIGGRTVNPTTWLLALYTPTSVNVAVALAGDSNLDASVNIADFSTLASHFNQSGFNWTGGDFDGNGTVGIGDFSALASNFNRSITLPLPRPSSVPEPVAMSFVALIGLAATRRRRTAIA